MWLVKRAFGVIFIAVGAASLLITSFFMGFSFPYGNVPIDATIRSAVIIGLSLGIVIAGTQLACDFEKV